MADGSLVVFGTGALGCWFAARLASAGERVTVAGTWPEGLRAIAQRGIHVDEPSRSFTARPAVAHVSEPLGPAEFVLALVKSHQTASIAPAAARAVSTTGRIVTLQNGLGNRELLEEAAGAERVRVGVVVAGARLEAPAVVSAWPATVTLAEAGDARMAELCAMLRRADVPVRVVDDIEPEVWKKLAVNCAINPLTALRGVPNGALLEDGDTRALMVAAAREVVAVAAARGVAIGDAAGAALEVARLTAGNRSSMLQDATRGARTEIDALCGAVVREAKRRGVAVPVNERLWREVLALEAARAAQAS
jgi:2-dehydropantoate 2-reductase